ncbi:MAG: hypothetical protein AB8H86_21200 [Polyangiales bacterium]
MKPLVLILGLIGCGTSTTTPRHSAGGEFTREEAIHAEAGRAEPAPASRSALAAAEPPASRSDAAAQSAATGARCALVSITPGLPPPPPRAPRTPELDALRVTYEASLAPAFSSPRDDSMSSINTWTQTVFSAWLRDATARLQTLALHSSRVPLADAPYARAWLSRAYAVFVERFHSAPIPNAIGGDPQMRSMYTRALSEHTQPLLQQSLEMLEGVVYPSAWADWKTEMTHWLDQEGCAFHEPETQLSGNAR